MFVMELLTITVWLLVPDAELSTTVGSAFTVIVPVAVAAVQEPPVVVTV